MPGPSTRKWTCARCTRYRWCEDFGGAKSKDLDEYSVCDFCLLEEKLQSDLRSLAESMKKMEAAHLAQLEEIRSAHQKEMKELKSAYEALKAAHSSSVKEPDSNVDKQSKKKKKKKKKKKTKKILERPGGSSDEGAEERVLQGGPCEAATGEVVSPAGSITAAAVEDDSTDEPSLASEPGYGSLRPPTDVEEGVEEIRHDDSSKDVAREDIEPEKSSKVKATEELNNANATEGEWKKVTSKKKKKRPINEKEGHSTARQGLHGNLFGDSQVRDLYLSKSSRRDVRVTSLPGKGNKDIRREVEKSSADKSGVAVIVASGNDLYTRRGNVGESPSIILDVMGAADDAAMKAGKRVVVGIIPRLRWSDDAYSKNIGINKSLKYLCREAGVTFVDPYDEFYDRPELFNRDGVHLSWKGKATLATLVMRGCQQVGLVSKDPKKKQQQGVLQKEKVSSSRTNKKVGDSNSQVSGNGSS